MNLLNKLGITKKGVKGHFVEGLTAFSFSLPIRVPIELLAGGLEAPEFWKSRLFGLITSLTIAPILIKIGYKWSEYVWKVDGDSSYLKKAGAALTFAIPLATTTYSLVLNQSGADLGEIIRTVPTNTVLSSAATAFVYLPCLEWMHKKFETTPAYLEKIKDIYNK